MYLYRILYSIILLISLSIISLSFALLSRLFTFPISLSLSLSLPLSFSFYRYFKIQYSLNNHVYYTRCSRLFIGVINNSFFQFKIYLVIPGRALYRETMKRSKGKTRQDFLYWYKLSIATMRQAICTMLGAYHTLE